MHSAMEYSMIITIFLPQKVSAVLMSHHKVCLSSCYVRMPDGVELAADIHLPADWVQGSQPLPTILHVTRYNRSHKVKTLPSWVIGESMNLRSKRYVDKMVKERGYAFVSVDTRGTGASFGDRPFDLNPAEISDLKHLVAWVKEQPWCNGRIGTGGISYDGMLGSLMAATDPTHSVSAVAMMFSPDDIYADLCAPGGILAKGFVDDYGKFTQCLEHNRPVEGVKLTPVFKLMLKALCGAMPVKGAEHRLADAVASHSTNWDMCTRLREVDCADQDFVTIPDPENTTVTKSLTPHDFTLGPQLIGPLRESGAAVHIYGGYYDSGSVRGAIRLFNQLSPEQRGLTLGPWTHGARQQCSPFSNSTTPEFDIFEDVARFWDSKLLDSSPTEPLPPVRVFTLGQEQLRTLPTWPIPNRRLWPLAFGIDGSIAAGEIQDTQLRPEEAIGPLGTSATELKHEVFSMHTSGKSSRWNLVQAMLMQPTEYGNRTKADTHLLTFTSAPIGVTAVVTGAPLVSLLLRPCAGGPDIALFVYLEVLPDPGSERVMYVTEGQLNPAHRPVDGAPARDPIVSPEGGSADASVGRFFNEKDVSPLSRDALTRVDVALEPVSIRLEPNYRIRVAVAGSDTHNFDLAKLDLATSWAIGNGELGDTSSSHLVAGSCLILPVEQ